MSDAMTNREIEDVLTSIRRLVAQDGNRPQERIAEPGRLILTEAQRVDAAAEAPIPAPETLPPPDFGRLEATIAELEAAVSASGGNWEGEAPAEAPRASNVTELYGRFTASPRRPAPEVALEALPSAASPIEEPAPAPTFAEETAADGQDPIASEALAAEGSASGAGAGDETLSEAGAEAVVIDEAALYALVAQIVREELQGQLGERITAQVRKLVRAEIAKALDERKFL